MISAGIGRQDGQPLQGVGHLVQSIGDILGTPIGTRVMRRDYGSRIPDLLDAPQNPETIMEIYMATAEALDKWEPRFRLTKISVPRFSAGVLELALEGVFEGQKIQIGGVVVQ